MEKDIVYIDYNVDINMHKVSPSGNVSVLSVKDFDIVFSAEIIWQYIKNCDIVYYNKSIVKICKLFSKSNIDYSFNSVSIIDVLELETALNPLSLDAILFRRTNKKIESNLQAITDIFNSQRSTLLYDIKIIDDIAQKDEKRVDTSGLLVEKDGVVWWKKENMIAHKNLEYTQRILNKGLIPKDTQEAIKKLFSRL